jgi:SanA protein
MNLVKLKVIKLGLVAVALFIAGAFAANMMIVRAATDKTYSDVRTIPHRRVGLVLGCQMRLSDGRLNHFFQARITAAVNLYRYGKIDYLLASGDTTDLRDALIGQGVPAERIYLDYAGFRTLDSVVRAKEVFGQTEVTIISQEFQAQRAIFIANNWRLDAIGFNAPEVVSLETSLREHFARVRAVIDIYLFRMQPRFLGERVTIGGASVESKRRKLHS